MEGPEGSSRAGTRAITMRDADGQAKPRDKKPGPRSRRRSLVRNPIACRERRCQGPRPMPPADRRPRPHRGRRRPRSARRTARSAIPGTAACRKARGPTDSRRPGGWRIRASRARVTCGVYLRPSASRPTRRNRRSCSACRSISAWLGATVATRARGRRPPNEVRAVEAQLELGPPHHPERGGDLMRHHVIHIADEPQGHVVILGIDPARARQPATQHRTARGRPRRGLQDR